MSLNELFNDILLDHYRHPRHRKVIEDPDARGEGANPLCGDEITLYVKLEHTNVSESPEEAKSLKVFQMGFVSRACAICTASTSIFCENAQGKTVEEIDRLGELFYRLLKGDPLSSQERADLGDAVVLEGVSRLPARVKCATLVYETWKELKRDFIKHNSTIALTVLQPHEASCNCGESCDCQSYK
ncbi:MAG: Fe-S cluster assembly sulfur transfer protein SufU [bacterium]